MADKYTAPANPSQIVRHEFLYTYVPVRAGPITEQPWLLPIYLVVTPTIENRNVTAIPSLLPSFQVLLREAELDMPRLDNIGTFLECGFDHRSRILSQKLIG